MYDTLFSSQTFDKKEEKCYNKKVIFLLLPFSVFTVFNSHGVYTTNVCIQAVMISKQYRLRVLFVIFIQYKFLWRHLLITVI